MKVGARNLEEPASGCCSRPQRFGFLLLPNFSMIALGASVDPLRLANSVLGRVAYEYVTLGIDLAPLRSSDGIRVLPDRALADGDDFDAAFVIGPNPIPRRGISEVTAWLQRMAARGVALGGIDTGSFFLARAGLLDGYRCTIHWEDRDVLLEQFPQMVVSSHLIEIDRDRYTCSGGVSPLDLMTVLLSRPPGSRVLAEEVSGLLVAQQRSPDEIQRVPLRHRLGGAHPLVIEAMQMMECNLEERLTPGEIAHYLNVSRRQLERLFQSQLGASPSRKYLEIRLERARLAVLRTRRPFDDIAQSTGFMSQSHFIARYREAFGRTPRADRAMRSTPS
jgi:transcriptional regulator GlxA family with amidase domain